MILGSVIALSAAALFATAQQSVAPTVPVVQPAAAARPTLTVLYDEIPDRTIERRAEALDAQPYLIIYQSCDPQAARTGVIDTEAVLKEIATKIAGQASTWGMLDFEEPFTANLQAGIDSPKYQATVQSMVSTLRAVKSRYPNIKWTYYGTPYLPYWLDGKTWTTATTEVKKAMLERVFKIYAPIIAEEDWVSPSIYPVYDPTIVDPTTPDAVREGGRAWRSSTVGIAKILAEGKRVIPTISPFWQPHGVAKAGTTVPQVQFIEDQVEPAIAAGASGVANWSGISYFIKVAINADAIDIQPDDAFGTRVWRAAFVTEYLDSQTPRDWNDPLVRATLVRKCSNTILDSIRWIRLAQSKAPSP